MNSRFIPLYETNCLPTIGNAIVAPLMYVLEILGSKYGPRRTILQLVCVCVYVCVCLCVQIVSVNKFSQKWLKVSAPNFIQTLSW